MRFTCQSTSGDVTGLASIDSYRGKALSGGQRAAMRQHCSVCGMCVCTYVCMYVCVCMLVRVCGMCAQLLSTEECVCVLAVLTFEATCTLWGR